MYCQVYPLQTVLVDIWHTSEIEHWKFQYIWCCAKQYYHTGYKWHPVFALNIFSISVSNAYFCFIHMMICFLRCFIYWKCLFSSSECFCKLSMMASPVCTSYNHTSFHLIWFSISNHLLPSFKDFDIFRGTSFIFICICSFFILVDFWSYII